MSLPKGFKRLEYIQSSGTQYINTEFNPNSNTRVVMDLLYTGNESISNEFGAWNGSSKDAFICLTTGKNNLYPFYGNTSQTVSVNRTERHTVDMDKNVVKLNENQLVDFNSVTFVCNYPLFLCCFNNAGVTENMTALRIYSCQIYDNGTLVRDFIPCQNAIGTVGLWDTVNEVFYGNAGTGTFIAGPEVAKEPIAPPNFRVVSESDTEVTLSWDAVEDAQGYLLRQSGGLIADTTDTTFAVAVQPFGYYTFDLSAYNEHGEGKRSTLVVFNMPDNPMIWLVTDRTTQDVTARNNKGTYQTADLNRVGSAVLYLKNLLEEHGFLVNVSPKVEWKDTEWMVPSDAKRYLADIAEIRNKLIVYNTTPSVPADLIKLKHTEANDIEQILLDVYAQYLIMLTTRIPSGAATSGGDYL